MAEMVGRNWDFLADLSQPDRFFVFIQSETPKYVPLPFVRFDYRSFNILPILMAVVFFFQMKFTTPPPQSEQQAQQQKIMRIIPFVFPIFLYSAPAGLTLYICTSTAAGIIDSYLVRKHIREQEEKGELLKKKEIKPGGLRDKLRKAADRKMKELEEKQRQMQQGGRGQRSGSTNPYKSKKKRKR